MRDQKRSGRRGKKGVVKEGFPPSQKKLGRFGEKKPGGEFASPEESLLPVGHTKGEPHP